MNRNRVTLLLATAGILILVGCHHTDTGKTPAGDPLVSRARQACEIDTLAKEHHVVIDKLDVVSETSDTVPEKIKDYRAEIDASYRFVVQNCNNYNMCMQAHKFDEDACADSRTAWAVSHSKFNELAERLAELEVIRPPKKPHHHHGSDCHANCGPDFDTGNDID